MLWTVLEYLVDTIFDRQSAQRQKVQENKQQHSKKHKDIYSAGSFIWISVTSCKRRISRTWCQPWSLGKSKRLWRILYFCHPQFNNFRTGLLLGKSTNAKIFSNLNCELKGFEMMCRMSNCNVLAGEKGFQLPKHQVNIGCYWKTNARFHHI